VTTCVTWRLDRCPRLWARYIDSENNAGAPTLIFPSHYQESPVPFCTCGEETCFSFFFYFKRTTLFTLQLQIWILAMHFIETLIRNVSEPKCDEASNKFKILHEEKLGNVCWMKNHTIFLFNSGTELIAMPHVESLLRETFGPKRNDVSILGYCIRIFVITGITSRPLGSARNFR
jgi:hypothetical protein